MNYYINPVGGLIIIVLYRLNFCFNRHLGFANIFELDPNT